MARVLAEGAVEIVPESEGFASELRGDLNRDLTAATAGLDKNVRVRVTTDVDTAEAQIRGGLARLQALSLGLLNRIQTRAGVLYRFLEQRVIIRTANKIREWTQKTIQRTKLLLEPYWRWMRERVDQIRRGWVRVRDTLTSAAEAVGRRWRATLTALGSAFDNVRNRAQRVFQGLADAAAPHLARLRRGIETLTTPFRVVRAYGQASFRIIGDAGATAFRRVQQAATPALRAVENGFDRAGAAARRWGSATQGAARSVADGLGRIRDGFRSAEAASSAFSGRLGTVGGVARRVVNGIREDVANLGRTFTVVTRAGDQLGTGVERIGTRLRGMGRDGRFSGRIMGALGNTVRATGLITRGVSGVIGGLTGMLSGATGAASTFAGGLGNLGRGLGAAGQAVFGVVTAFGKFVAIGALVAVVAGAITYAIGAVGALLTGIPALALGAAASIGVFVLGMDGIKRAFERTKPAVDALKVAVSDAFERTMIPAAERLANTVLPGMTDSMVRLAEAFGNGTTRLVEFVARAENMRMINQIIDNMAQNVTGQLIPALENIIGAFLRIGSNAAIMRDIVGIFTDLTNRTAAWLDEMNRTGQAEQSLGNLRGVLDSLVDLFFRLLTASMQFFDAATPGMTSLLDSIRPNEEVMRTLGEAFGTAAEAAGEFLNAIPAETWQELADAAKRLAEELLALARDPGFKDFMKSAAEAVTELIDAITTGIGWIRDLSAAFDSVGATIDSFLHPLGLAQGTMDDTGAAAQGAAGQIEGALPPAFDSAGSAADTAGGAVETATGIFENIEYGVAVADRALANLGLGFTTAEQDAILAANGIEAGVPPAFDAVGAAAERGGQRVSDGFMSPVAGLAGQAGNALAPLPGAVEPPFTGAAVAAQVGAEEARRAAEEGFGQIAPLAGTALNPLPGVVAPPVDSAAAAVKAGADKAAADAAAGFQPIPPDAAAALSGLAPAVQGAMDAASSAADSGAQQVQDAVRSGMDAAAAAAEGAMPRVATAVESAMDAAGAAADSGGQRIGDAIRAGADAAASAAEAALPRVSDAVTTAMDTAAAAAESGGQQIEDALRTSTEAAAEAIESGMERITTAVDDGMQQAVDAATDGSQQIEDALRTSFDAVVQLTEDAWRRIVQAFQQGGQQAVSIARATGDQIVSTFRALAGPMYDAGFQIIARLAAGMIAAQGQAFAAAASTAAGIRAQFPASPAKEGPLSGRGDPLRSGGVIIERLAAGIAASGAAVQAALGPILASLVAQVNQATVNPMVDAAREILARLQSGGPIYEDLTWRGASANVGRYNDGLLDAMDQSGVRDPRAFLEDFIRRNTPGDTPTGGGGGVLGELQTQTAVLIGMRGDLAGAGYGPDMLARLDELIAAVSGNAGSATGKAGSLRDLSEMGAFP